MNSTLKRNLQQAIPWLDAAPRPAITWQLLAGVALILAGIGLHMELNAFYGAPLVIGTFCVIGVLVSTILGGRDGRDCFLLSFGLGVFAASLGYGLTVVESDPAGFYYESYLGDIHEPLRDIATRNVAPLPILVWRYVYAAFHLVNVAPNPGIGTGFNALLVGVAGAITVAVVHRVYPGNRPAVNFTILAYSLYGMNIMLAALHLRDGFVLFCVSITTLLWIRTITTRGLRSLFVAALGAIGVAFVIYYSRAESIYALVLLSVLGLFIKLRPRLGAWRSAIFGVMVLAVAGYLLRSDVIDLLTYSAQRRLEYTDISTLSSSANSIGWRLIINQPLFIRLLLGSFYILYFPVPIWAGFNGSFYSAMTSVNAVYMLWMTPYIVVGTWVIWKNFRLTSGMSDGNLLISSVFWVNFLSVVATSFEIRHIASTATLMIATASAPVAAKSGHRGPLRKVQLGWLAFGLIINGLRVVIKR